ncbi:hypothetical protein PJ900_21060 [Tistrella mobilis]|uniref:hypothetical protein n=1 Tax=Tistrella mobilis TaxID=171437 RepID=UPI0012E918BA|nr:hypothetical protein [Tistrella mobilis]
MTLRILITGSSGASQAAEALQKAFDAHGEVEFTSATLPSSDITHRGMDPVAVAALIMSIPAAVHATVDLIQRARRRKQATEAIHLAMNLTIQHKVEIYVDTPSGLRKLTEMKSDQILDLAEGKHPPS